MARFASNSSGPATARRNWPVVLAAPLGIFVATASLAGILFPSTYAGETVDWAAQGLAQDWVDLVVAVPLLVLGIFLARQCRSLGVQVLSGTTMFVAYSFAIYAFDIHFNRLFLVYCAALGLSAFSTAGLMLPALAVSAAPSQAASRGARLAGWFLVVLAIGFGLLWLAVIVPATLQGTTPAAVAAAGLPTNPVHVIDLSLFLPAELIVGISLLRGRSVGTVLAPAFLIFGALMAINLAAIMAFATPGQGGFGPAITFLAFALVEIALLAGLHPRPVAGVAG